jgi:hypothetical protein
MMRSNQVINRIWPRFIDILVIAVLTFGLSQEVSASPLQEIKLKVNPASGRPGSTASLSGTGWTPSPTGSPYEIHWNSKTGALLGNFSPNQNGSFSKNITIPAGANPGQHQIWACQGCGNPNIVKWQSTSFTISVPTPPPTREPTICDPSGAAGELVVDFDDIPVGDEILDVLLPEGVIFSLEYPTVVSFWGASSGSHALANEFAPGNEFGSAGTPLVMEFQYIQDSIGMYIGTNVVEAGEGGESAITATLTAYGEDGDGHPVVVGTATETLSSEINPMDTCLWLEAPGQIIKATLSYGPGAGVGAPELIDDLVLRGPEVPVPVPEDDTPPVVTINDPLEGSVSYDSFVRLEGDILENRRLDRVEVWVNGAYLKDIGAAWMGLEQYWFLDVVGREDLIGCGENTIEVVAYDNNGNQGRDQVTFTYLGEGDLELTAIEPVQVMFGAPLIKEKSTAFRATLNSSFTCEMPVNFLLELPDGQWNTNPPSTGWVFTDVPLSWSYPEIWGPVPIPPLAADYEVMLPYLAPGTEGGGFDTSSNPAGLLGGDFVGGLSGPDVRVVPRPVQDTVSFTVEIDPEDELVEVYETNNRLESGDLEVITTRPLRLTFVPWVFELYPTSLETESDYEYYLREAGYTDIESRLEAVMGAESQGSVPFSLAVSPEDLERVDREARRYVDFFLATFPFADSKISYHLLDTFYFEEEYLKDHDHNTCFNGPFIADMHDAAVLADPGVDVVILFRLFGCCGQSPGVYVDAGLEVVGAPPNWIHQMNNEELDPSDEHYACWNWDFPLDGAAAYVISHELNHALLGYRGECYDCTNPAHMGVDCAFCNTDADGFWVNAWMPIPEGTPYFSHAVCHECIYWNRLEPSRNKHGAENPDGYLNAIEVFSPIEDPVALLVRGQITSGDEVSLKPFLILPDSNLDLQPGGDGDHFIVLYDDSGAVLSRWGFTPSFETYPPPPSLPVSVPEIHFSYRVLWQEGIQRVEILNQAGQVLAARDVSAASPEVRVLSPNGGENWRENKSYRIKWEASDVDGDTLLSSLLLSRDGGETWTTLALDLEDREYEIKAAGLQAGSDYLVKVIVSDGVNTGEDLSDSSFSVGTGPVFSAQLPLYLAGAGLAIAAIVLGAFYLVRRRKKT